jgi:hypothetical protein
VDREFDEFHEFQNRGSLALIRLVSGCIRTTCMCVVLFLLCGMCSEFRNERRERAIGTTRHHGLARPIGPSTQLSIHPSIHPSTHPSIHPSAPLVMCVDPPEKRWDAWTPTVSTWMAGSNPSILHPPSSSGRTWWVRGGATCPASHCKRISHEGEYAGQISFGSARGLAGILGFLGVSSRRCPYRGETALARGAE